MNILHVKSIELTHISCIRRSFWRFLAISGDFCRFKLALPSQLFMSKDDFDHILLPILLLTTCSNFQRFLS